MDTHRLFQEFDSSIRLNDSKIKKLKTNRDALRQKIRNYFKEHEWTNPKFASQGSFPLNTNLNPIKKETEDGDVKEEYDLDDGLYFICPEPERKMPSTYHERIKKAVEGHAQSIVDKTTCVRVIYADGHHIDLPSYWLAKDGDVPMLTHKSKGFIQSDPKAFKQWVDNEITKANSNGQLRRIIRFLKAWKNFREHKNNSLRLPSGFILTILACKHYCKDARDDLSFQQTVKSIKQELESSFQCYRPTVPTDEELLSEYSKDTVLDELGTLLNNADLASEADCEKKSSEYWRKIFGERFPLGKEREAEDESMSQSAALASRVQVSPPWSFR